MRRYDAVASVSAIGSHDVSHLRMLVCLLACNCSVNASLPACSRVCVCMCVTWLMIVLVEAEPLWLQPQAAPGFSLTYDNAPVTLTQEPCSTLLWVDVRTFSFFPRNPRFLPQQLLLLLYLLLIFLRTRLSSAAHRDADSLQMEADAFWPPTLCGMHEKNQFFSEHFICLQTQTMAIFLWTGHRAAKRYHIMHSLCVDSFPAQADFYLWSHIEETLQFETFSGLIHRTGLVNVWTASPTKSTSFLFSFFI